MVWWPQDVRMLGLCTQWYNLSSGILGKMNEELIFIQGLSKSQNNWTLHPFETYICHVLSSQRYHCNDGIVVIAVLHFGVIFKHLIELIKKHLWVLWQYCLLHFFYIRVYIKLHPTEKTWVVQKPNSILGWIEFKIHNVLHSLVYGIFKHVRSQSKTNL